ncbi:hypothetical protein ACJIZ3_000783 [Penstemon smallii]|uniref:Pentatricopeptide repeat-containing protein n=1 Tax=Penstemon smallii TaxID=265156 RepID=A0ABD3U274_9LAMI
MTSKKLRNYPCVVGDFLNLSTRGQLRQAVGSLPLLSRKGILLNSKTIASLIQQCANSKSIKEGKWVHVYLRITGSKHPNIFLSNHLINMYAKCGDHVKAREVFDKMRERNLYSWNHMLSGYAHLGMVKAANRLFDRMPKRDFVSWNTMVMSCVQSGRFREALRFYMELRRVNIGYNEYSFAGVLTACVKLKELWLAKQLHCQVFLVGFMSNVVLTSSIIDAYAKCGEMRDARRLFDEMITKDVLTWTTLVSGYAQWGDMKSAQEVFDLMPQKNSVSWTALIAGYAQNDMGHDALKLLSEMIILRVEPDQFTFSSSFLACANIVSLENGKQLHSCLITSGLRPNVVVLSSLIDMYSKCGNLKIAKRVFDMAENKQSVVLWNTIISALEHHGCGKQAMNMFADMVKLGITPDSVTFHVLLNACSHSGLVQEGLCLFESMSLHYNIVPNQEHYACLINLLGWSGCFDEMMNVLKKMTCKFDDRVWNALLGVCRIHGDIGLGKIAAKHLVELEPRSPAAYLLLSSIYAALGRWESAHEVRRLMSERSVQNGFALSWCEIDQKLHLDTEKERSLVLELLDDQSTLYNICQLRSIWVRSYWIFKISACI